MRVLLVEGNPGTIRRFLAAFREQMPYAKMDIASSQEESGRAVLQGYDAYIVTNFFPDGGSTRGITEEIKRRNLSAVILHNGTGLFSPEAAEMQNVFSRDSGSRIVLCRGNPETAIRFLKAMVAEEGGKARLRQPQLKIVPAVIRKASSH